MADVAEDGLDCPESSAVLKATLIRIDLTLDEWLQRRIRSLLETVPLGEGESQKPHCTGSQSERCNQSGLVLEAHIAVAYKDHGS
jgi:hypothetical protein